MSSLIDLAMFGSLLFTPLLFLLMPVRRALVTSYCVLWMFLPVSKIMLPGLPDLSKPAAIGLGALIAITLFYGDMVIRRFRLRWFDVPVILFGFAAPLASAMMNGLGVESALDEAIESAFLWLVPYFAGRLVLGDEQGVHELAMGIFIAALIYAPLAWLEMLASPQLHMRVYGYHPNKFNQAVRGWSYRPMLFMSHGLMVAMWLVAGATCGVWLLKHKMLRWKWPVPAWAAVLFLFMTALLCNSMGAVLLMLVALAALFMSRKVSPIWVLVPVLLVAPVYVLVRSTDTVTREQITSLVEPISSNRAGSIDYRLYSEGFYVDKAWQRPIFGWGGHGRHRPVDAEANREIGASDGLWIIAFGKTGLVGLISMLLTILLAPMIMLFKQPVRVWRSAAFAPSAVLSVLLMIYAVDNLMNAMVNPIYMLAAGALASYATRRVSVTTELSDRLTGAARRRARAYPHSPPTTHPA